MSKVTKVNMAKIDRDMKNIVKLLFENGFNPLASCDGVLDSHEDKESVTSAYFSIFDSEKGRDLAAHFMNINDIDGLSVDFSSRPYEPYEFYGNIVDDFRISIYFSNHFSENTNRVYNEIFRVVSGTDINENHRKFVDDIFVLFDRTPLIMSVTVDQVKRSLCEIFIDYPECQNSCEFPYIYRVLELCGKKFHVRDRFEDMKRFTSVYYGFVLRAEYLEIESTKVLGFIEEFNNCCKMVPMIPIEWINIVNSQNDYEY